VPVQEYVNYGSDGGLGGHGGVRREDDKQQCWGCGARSRKHGKIIEGSGRLQEQTEGDQRSWVAKSRILPEQRQDTLKEGLCGCTRCVYEISLIAPQASVIPNELVLMRKQVAWRVGIEEAIRNQTASEHIQAMPHSCRGLEQLRIVHRQRYAHLARTVQFGERGRHWVRGSEEFETHTSATSRAILPPPDFPPFATKRRTSTSSA
jgi:hypothetical protein